jgi:plastocyanin
MPHFNVVITKASKHTCVLDEGSLAVSVGDTITWTNTTAKKAILLMPHDQVAEGQDHFHRKIDENGGMLTLTISGGRGATYRYGIFCRATNSFAIGSDPEIIVQ